LDVSAPTLASKIGWPQLDDISLLAVFWLLMRKMLIGTEYEVTGGEVQRAFTVA
jgi:hypothetical protein